MLASEIDKEPPWAMLFADDLVLCETSRAAVERELEIWRNQFERHGLRVSRTKRAYMPCNDYDNNSRNYEETQLGDDKLNTVRTFKYVGSIFDSNGGAERGINNRVKLAWMKWKQRTGVLCDKKVPIKLKDKVYKGNAHKNCIIQVWNCEKMKFVVGNCKIQMCPVQYII